jgi:putative chitobiose transport system permease protein
VKKLTPYLFVGPALLLLLLFIIVPMLEVVWFSLLNYSFFGPNEFIGLDNYRRLLTDRNFWWTLFNSLLYVSVTPVLIVVSLIVALSIRNSVRSAKVIRLLFFLPVITPVIVVGIMWKWIFTEESGVLNYLLSLFGIGNVPWLTRYPTNMVSVMILTVWRGFGYYMMIILAGLALIPKEIEEAGELDGAGPFQQVIHIILPNLKPTLLFIFVVSSSSAIKLFTELYVLIPGVPMDNKTLVAYLYRQSFERFDFGYGSAIAVVLFVITSFLSYANIRMMERRA